MALFCGKQHPRAPFNMPPEMASNILPYIIVMAKVIKHESQAV